MTFRKTLAPTVLALSLLALSACESSKERAEKFYESGMAYLEQGDVDRALVEFRNVFKLDGEHREARRAYAQVERDRGRLREAFSQYLRLIEQYPDDMDALQALSELAVANGDWAIAQRYTTAATAIDPQNATILALKAAADYGTAAEASDSAGVVDAMKRIRAFREQQPDNILLRRVIIDDLLRAQDFAPALKEIDEAIQLEPKDRQLFAQRMAVLAALGDDGEVEKGLIDMVSRFPEAPEMSETLVRWYVARKELDKAEAHLRGRLAPNTTDVARVFDLVRFLAENRGNDAAVKELDAVIAGGADSAVFLSARAGFLFDLGRRDDAVADMRDVLKMDADPADARRIKIGLARMLTLSSQEAEARGLVDDVLSDDSGNVEALKLKAGWLIRDDQIGEAISTLRRAIDANPNDATLMTLMAQAYERDGNRDLMREMLSLAVAASNRAPDDSLRYAQFLAGENKLLQAEGVIIDSLRLSPGNTGLLVPLGQLYVAMQDWPRAAAVVDQLAQSDDANARGAAIAIRTAVLNGQQKGEEAIGYLQELVDRGQADLGTKIAVLRAHIANNQIARAVAFSDQLLLQEPDNAELRFVNGSVKLLAGQLGAAEAIMRQLVDEDPTRVQAWLALVRIVGTDPGRTAETEALIEKATAADPNSAELKWANAGLLERKGDFAGAIAIYEALYKENSGNPIVANNLASLLSIHSADPDALNRAELIARRLRGSTMPAFQDTFGWIAYLRGNYAEAESELVKAAAGLPDDPSVQYHLAMAYLARDKKSQALAQLQKTLSLAPTDGPRAEVFDKAKQEVDKLEAAGISVGN